MSKLTLYGVKRPALTDGRLHWLALPISAVIDVRGSVVKTGG